VVAVVVIGVLLLVPGDRVLTVSDRRRDGDSSAVLGRRLRLMPLFSFEGRSPQVHPEAWVAPTATLVGDVVVEAGASIWYGAVLRADLGPIYVRSGANVQDGCVLHGGDDPATEIGPGATVGHLCVVHGAVVGAEAVIGNGSVIQDGARVGARALIGAGSTVPPMREVEPETVSLGPIATTRGPLTEGARWWVENNPGFYAALARRHAAGIDEVR
jgi:carbonic anhydrase/acetyltransferase-like protein (isoleucine patch superfamily)